MITSKKSYGFTLVELSIVLVIIGLLIGGILVGQSLIESRKISKIISDISQIQIAVTNFKNKYKYLPGDHPQGYQFGCPAGANWQCTGNANKVIDWNERLNSWYQLGASQIYKGTFLGRDSGTVTYIAGSDIPAVKEIGDNAGYMLSSAYTSVWPATANSILIAKNTVNGPALKVEQTRTLDDKMDDGKYDSGKVYGAGTAYVCTGFGSYYLSNTSPNACVLFVQLNDY